MTFGPPKSLPSGPWQVKVSLVSGLTTAGATATVAFGAVVPAQTGVSFTTWLGIALGVMVVALIVAAFALRQRRAAARHSEPV
jgi:amino acid transporter